MSEPRETPTTSSAQALPSYAELAAENANLRAYIARQRDLVEEAFALEQACLASVTDTIDGYRAARDCHRAFEASSGVRFPHVQRIVRNALYALACRSFAPAIVTGEEGSPSAFSDFQRCEGFRQDPGADLPGAVPVRMRFPSPLVDGLVRFEGHDVPWVFSSQGVRRTALAELTRYMQATGLERGIIVGTHIEPGVEIPRGVLFVKVA